MKVVLHLVAAIVFSAWTVGVMADPISVKIEFVASDFFFPNNPSGVPPVDPVSGSISLTYDPTGAIVGGTLDSIDLVIDGFRYSTSNIAFDYVPEFGRFLVGGTVNGISSVSGQTDDFYWSFTLSQSFGFVYATRASSGTYLADPRIPPSMVEFDVDSSRSCKLSPSELQDSVRPPPPGEQDEEVMARTFTPSNGCSLKEVSEEMGYDHFNWVQVITHYDGKLQTYNVKIPHWPAIGKFGLPLIDPPRGGWLRDTPNERDVFVKTADALDYYLDEVDGFDGGDFYLNNVRWKGDTYLSFSDIPRSSAIDEPGEHMAFTTSLVGVVGGNAWVPLYTFKWKSNYNGETGGVSSARDISPPNGGTGGVYDVEVLDDPFDVDVEVKELWYRNGAFDSAPVEVAFDIKPGEYPGCVSRKSKGTIPVAVLGSTSIDVYAIDALTLRLSGLAVRVKKNGSPQCRVEDVDNDGNADLLCNFQNNIDAWEESVVEVLLKGKLQDGSNIFGLGATCLVP